MGKGSTPRPVDKAKYNDNFDKIFGEKNPKDFQKGNRVKPKVTLPNNGKRKWL